MSKDRGSSGDRDEPAALAVREETGLDPYEQKYMTGQGAVLRREKRPAPRWLQAVTGSMALVGLAMLFTPAWATGLVFVPLTTTALAVVPASRMANATGLYNVVRNVGASAGVAILTTMLARQTQAHQASLVERERREGRIGDHIDAEDVTLAAGMLATELARTDAPARPAVAARARRLFAAAFAPR